MPGAGCLKEPPHSQGRGREQPADSDLAGPVETAVGDAHWKEDGTRTHARGWRTRDMGHAHRSRTQVHGPMDTGTRAHAHGTRAHAHGPRTPVQSPAAGRCEDGLRT